METAQKNLKILVVDDDEDFLLQQKMMLERAGYRVLTAPGREEAEKIIAEQSPDLLIVDLMMEEKDGGFILAHRVKQQRPQIPVIMVTAVIAETGLEFDTSTRDDRSWIKADAILTKPVRFEQLQREIERLTQKS